MPSEFSAERSEKFSVFKGFIKFRELLVNSAIFRYCRYGREDSKCCEPERLLGFESLTLRHKRTLILIQRLAFFLCSKSLAPQGFFHYVGCMERAFSLFFGCKWHLMLVSPYSALPVGCMIKRLLVAVDCLQKNRQ